MQNGDSKLLQCFKVLCAETIPNSYLGVLMDRHHTWCPRLLRSAWVTRQTRILQFRESNDDNKMIDMLPFCYFVLPFLACEWIFSYFSWTITLLFFVHMEMHVMFKYLCNFHWLWFWSLCGAVDALFTDQKKLGTKLHVLFSFFGRYIHNLSIYWLIM